MSTTVSYKGDTIVTVNNSTKVLETGGTWLEDDITLVDVTSGGSTLGTKTITQNGTYDATNDSLDGYSEVTVNVSGGVTPTGTKQISITENGTTTEDVTNYANAEITVNVSGGGRNIADELADGEPSGTVTISKTAISAYAFYHKNGMTSVSAPNCTSIDGYAFQDCSGLTSISFPALTSITGDYIFSGCSNLTEVAFPLLATQTRARFFAGCSKLVTIDLGETPQIFNQTFINSGALRKIILRRTSGVASLAGYNVNVLGGIYNNPTASTIYVPSALISAYQTASNWSSAYNAGVTFAAIEGSEYE